MSREMKKEMIERLHAESGHVGFYYQNLVTGEEFGFHEEEEFLSATQLREVCCGRYLEANRG